MRPEILLNHVPRTCRLYRKQLPGTVPKTTGQRHGSRPTDLPRPLIPLAIPGGVNRIGIEPSVRTVVLNPQVGAVVPADVPINATFRQRVSAWIVPNGKEVHLTIRNARSKPPTKIQTP